MNSGRDADGDLSSNLILSNQEGKITPSNQIIINKSVICFFLLVATICARHLQRVLQKTWKQEFMQQVLLRLPWLSGDKLPHATANNLSHNTVHWMNYLDTLVRASLGTADLFPTVLQSTLRLLPMSTS